MDNNQQTSHLYVDNASAVAALLSHMGSAESVAIDTEADSLYHYYHKVCLIQITLDEQNYIVDPLSDVDLDGFLATLAQKPLILHDAGYDLRMMRSSFGFKPENKVFDTMLAAQLLGHEKFGLGSLVENFFGIVMPKGGQKSDWSRRPLSPNQLMYATEDTFYLHKLAEIFADELEKLQRTDWHQQWCEKTLQAVESYKPAVDPEDAWRIKGARFLDIEALTQLRSIWKWREVESQKEDVPPFKVMQNSLMLRLAVWASRHSRTSLSKGPRLPKNCRGRRLQELKKAIALSYEIPESEKPRHPKPKHHPKPPPETNQIFEELKTECDRIAAELNIASQVLSSRAKLKSIAMRKPRDIEEIQKCGGIMKWQADLLAPSIENILKEFPEK